MVVVVIMVIVVVVMHGQKLWPVSKPAGSAQTIRAAFAPWKCFHEIGSPLLCKALVEEKSVAIVNNVNWKR